MTIVCSIMIAHIFFLYIIFSSLLIFLVLVSMGAILNITAAEMKNSNTNIYILICSTKYFSRITHKSKIIFETTVHFHILSACQPPQKLRNGIKKKRNEKTISNDLKSNPIISAIIIFSTTSYTSIYPYLYIFKSSCFNTLFCICFSIILSIILSNIKHLLLFSHHFICLFYNIFPVFLVNVPNSTFNVPYLQFLLQFSSYITVEVKFRNNNLSNFPYYSTFLHQWITIIIFL